MKKAPLAKDLQSREMGFAKSVDDILLNAYGKTELESNENSRILRGIGGMVAGYFLLGPIGWLAGPIIVFTMNRYKIDEARADVMEGLKKSLSKKESQVLAECTSLLRNYACKRRDAYIAAFDASIKEYSKIYNKVEKQTKNLWEKYEQEISVLEKFLTQIETWEKQNTKTA